MTEKNKGGAPAGNKNGANARYAKAALEKCLAIKSGQPDLGSTVKFSALIKIWDAMYDKAIDGDTTASNMIMDRLDGKPGQSIDLGPDTTVHFHLDYKNAD